LPTQTQHIQHTTQKHKHNTQPKDKSNKNNLEGFVHSSLDLHAFFEKPIFLPIGNLDQLAQGVDVVSQKETIVLLEDE